MIFAVKNVSRMVFEGSILGGMQKTDLNSTTVLFNNNTERCMDSVHTLYKLQHTHLIVTTWQLSQSVSLETVYPYMAIVQWYS